MTMFVNALEAHLPVLRATTTDIVNLPEVLEHLLPDTKVAKYVPTKIWAADVYYSVTHVEVDSAIYTSMVDHGKTLLLINQEDESGLALNVGEVPVPYEMLFDLVESVVGKKATYKLMVAFQGLTLKAASEVLRMVKAQHDTITVEAVLNERARMVGKLKGLALVDVGTSCYLPNAELQRWAKKEKPYFESAKDPRLVPRGLLFGGVPGTGKTQGAKFLAREFGVPLHRLDMASSLAKWVGESEANFGRVLSMLDQNEPSVFLIDEVEKLFESGGEDAGTTSRILSQLLWWLSEHTSRILTVMTTNNRDALPKELYRSGRIDRVMEFVPMQTKQAIELAAALCTSFKVPLDVKLKSNISMKSQDGITPAAVTQIVYDHIKDTQKCLGP